MTLELPLASSHLDYPEFLEPYAAGVLEILRVNDPPVSPLAVVVQPSERPGYVSYDATPRVYARALLRECGGDLTDLECFDLCRDACVPVVLVVPGCARVRFAAVSLRRGA